MAYVVTISATYGAAGSVVGPALAERLGVAFLDRAIPATVAREIGCSLQEVLEHDDRAPTGVERLLASAARLPTVTLGSVDATFVGATDAEGRLLYDQEFVDHTDRVLRRVSEQGGVILGRAAAVVLAGHQNVLHVRLDGPKERRLEQAMRIHESAPEKSRASGTGGRGAPSKRELEDNDRARAAYVRRFYRTDPSRPELYHLVLDSTALPFSSCVSVVERLARDRAGE